MIILLYNKSSWTLNVYSLTQEVPMFLSSRQFHSQMSCVGGERVCSALFLNLTEMIAVAGGWIISPAQGFSLQSQSLPGQNSHGLVNIQALSFSKHVSRACQACDIKKPWMIKTIFICFDHLGGARSTHKAYRSMLYVYIMLL